MVGWLVLLYILEVHGWNLGPEIDYPDWGISWFSTVAPGKSWASTKICYHIVLHSLTNSVVCFISKSTDLRVVLAEKLAEVLGSLVGHDPEPVLSSTYY